MRLLDLVKDQQAHFQYYRDNALWYKTDNGFMFPVPISDVGTATFRRDEKAMLFMKWIRSYNEEIEKESVPV